MQTLSSVKLECKTRGETEVQVITSECAESKSGQVLILGLHRVHPSPENDKLYGPINESDPDFVGLVNSIEERGILDPLVITRDRFIVSGHRRYAAAKKAGLSVIPCRMVGYSRHDDDEFLRALREFNRQRVKTRAEALREEIVSADPEEAYRVLVEHREKKAQVRTNSNMSVGEERQRAKISKAKRPFLDAVLNVITRLNDFLPVSDRQIHYALLNNPPLIHASKPRSTYQNNVASYKALTDLLIRARIEGSVQWDVIHDPTRPVDTWDVFAQPAPFMRREIDGFLKGYYRDLQQSQPNHIEIVGEKNTIHGVIQPIAARYCIPMTIARGYCSGPPRKQIVERYQKSGKEKLIILFLSDFDPDGEEISNSFTRSLRDDFGIDEIHPIKVALTGQQVSELNLPEGLEAKKSSRNYGKFAARHGGVAYELESVEPSVLQRMLSDAIDSVLDIDAFNAEVEKEKQDAAFLDTVRRRLHAVMMEEAT